MSFADVRKKYDLIHVAEQYGLELKGPADRKWGLCRFPFHMHSANPDASFSIYPYGDTQRFKCHGTCGVQGDVIDFVGYMELSRYNPRDNVLKEQAVALLTKGDIEVCPPVVKEQRILLPEFAWEQFVPIRDNARAYLRARGITDAVVDECRFGSATQLVEENGIQTVVRQPVDRLISIPTFHAGSLVGIKLRILRARSGYKYFSYKGSRAGLWNHDEVYLTTLPVLIGKGELCGATMKSAGFLACSLTSGEAGTTSRMELFKPIRTALSLARKVFVGDNDAAGRKHGPLRADLLDARLEYPPDPYKDWDQWYLCDRPECLRVTNQWLETAAKP